MSYTPSTHFFARGQRVGLRDKNYHSDVDVDTRPTLETVSALLGMKSKFAFLPPLLTASFKPIEKDGSQDVAKGIEGYTEWTNEQYDTFFSSDESYWIRERQQHFTDRIFETVWLLSSALLSASKTTTGENKTAVHPFESVPDVHCRKQLVALWSFVGTLLYSMICRGHIIQKDAHDAKDPPDLDTRPRLCVLFAVRNFSPLFKSHDVNRSKRGVIHDISAAEPVEKPKRKPKRKVPSQSMTSLKKRVVETFGKKSGVLVTDEPVPDPQPDADSAVADDGDQLHHIEPGAVYYADRPFAVSKNEEKRYEDLSVEIRRSANAAYEEYMRHGAGRSTGGDWRHVFDENAAYAKEKADNERFAKNKLQLRSTIGDMCTFARWHMALRVFNILWRYCHMLVIPDLEGKRMPVNMFALVFCRLCSSALNLMSRKVFPYDLRTDGKIAPKASDQHGPGAGGVAAMETEEEEKHDSNPDWQYVGSASMIALMESHCHVNAYRWSQDFWMFNMPNAEFPVDQIIRYLGLQRNTVKAKIANIYSAHYRIKAFNLGALRNCSTGLFVPFHGIVFEQFVDSIREKMMYETNVLTQDDMHAFEEITLVLRRARSGTLVVPVLSDDKLDAKRKEPSMQNWPDLATLIAKTPMDEARAALLPSYVFLYYALQPSDVKVAPKQPDNKATVKVDPQSKDEKVDASAASEKSEAKAKGHTVVVASKAKGMRKRSRNTDPENKYISTRHEHNKMTDRIFGADPIALCKFIDSRMNVYGLNAMRVRQPKNADGQLAYVVPNNICPHLCAFGLGLTNYNGDHVKVIAASMAYSTPRPLCKMVLSIEPRPGRLHFHTIVCRCGKEHHSQFEDDAKKHGFTVFDVKDKDANGADIRARVAVHSEYCKAKKLDANSMHVQFFLRYECMPRETLFIAYALASCYDRDFAFRLFQSVLYHNIPDDDPRRNLVGPALMQYLIQPNATTDLCKAFRLPTPTDNVVSNVQSFLARRRYIEPMRPGSLLSDFQVMFSVYVNTFERQAIQIIGRETVLRNTVVAPIKQRIAQFIRDMRGIISHPLAQMSATCHGLLAAPGSDASDAVELLSTVNDMFVCSLGVVVDMDDPVVKHADQDFKDTASEFNAFSAKIKMNHVPEPSVTADEERKLLAETDVLFSGGNNTVVECTKKKKDADLVVYLVFRLKQALMSYRTQNTQKFDDVKLHKSTARDVTDLLLAWQKLEWPWSSRKIQAMRVFATDATIHTKIAAFITRKFNESKTRALGDGVFRASSNNPLLQNVGSHASVSRQSILPRGIGIQVISAEPQAPVGHE